jgi:hypothetical protein
MDHVREASARRAPCVTGHASRHRWDTPRINHVGSGAIHVRRMPRLESMMVDQEGRSVAGRMRVHGKPQHVPIRAVAGVSPLLPALPV